MKILILLITAVLAGCVTYTPQQVMDAGDRYTAHLAKPPKDAAYCVARVGENIHGAISSNVRPLEGEAMEVVFRAGTDPGMAISVIRLVPDGAGSLATIWWRPRYKKEPRLDESVLERDARERRDAAFTDEGAAKLFKGC